MEPDADWKSIAYDDSFWSVGNGGIGYGDGDDVTVIPPVSSVYLRTSFTVLDTSLFRAAILHADYDDGFVAYLNGIEMCRSNIGSPGIVPSYNDPASGFREATMYAGGLPESYYWSNPNFRSALQPGENVLAVQVHNQNIASSDLSAIFFLSLASPDNVGLFPPPPSWFYAPTNYSNLPLLVVTTDGSGIPDEPKVAVRLQIADAGPGNYNFSDGPFDAYDGPAGIETRGNSSLFFAKQSFGLEIQDAAGEGVSLGMLGMPAEDDWVLNGPYSDKSLMRNALALYIAAQIDPWAPRYRFCELYIDGDYRGIYLAMERIEVDDNRVDIARLNPVDLAGDELTGGYIVKIDRPLTEPFEGWYSPYWPVNHFFQFHDPQASALLPVQRDYIRQFVTSFEDALWGPDFADSINGYTKWANRHSLAGHFIIQETSNNIDAYRLSTFLYKDKDSEGGRLQMGPAWDYNLGFGNVDYCSSTLSTTEWAYEADDFCGSPQPFWWDRLMLDVQFRNTLRCRWDSLRAGPLQTDRLFTVIDSLQELLDDAAIRNFERWPILGTYVWPNAFIGSSWEEEITWMKAWVEDRMYWMDLATPGYCDVPVPNAIAQNEQSPIRVYPSIFSHQLFVESAFGSPVFFHLSNLTGQSVDRITLDAGKRNRWEVPASLAPGPYFWTVHDKTGRVLQSGMIIHER